MVCEKGELDMEADISTYGNLSLRSGSVVCPCRSWSDAKRCFVRFIRLD